MNVPVSIPAQAFDRSKFTASAAPIACLIPRLSGGSKCCECSPFDRVMLAADQHLDIRGLMPRMSQAVASRSDGEREGVLARAHHVTLVDARQPLQLDTRAMSGPAHQLAGREGGGRQPHADALDPASPRGSRTGRFENHPVIRLLLAPDLSHRHSSSHMALSCTPLRSPNAISRSGVRGGRGERHPIRPAVASRAVTGPRLLPGGPLIAWRPVSRAPIAPAGRWRGGAPRRTVAG